MPEGMYPIIVAGGSFNNDSHRTALRTEDKALLDRILELADPGKNIFVIGHSLTAQEGYLAKMARGKFRVIAIVPNRITKAERARLSSGGVGVIVSIESSAMGLYKSFSYEIFRRMPSALLAFDGNSAVQNLIQEARNGRKNCRIYLNPRSRALAAKAKMLEGYVRPLREADQMFSVPDPDG